jgi:hypothetical protein
LALIRASAAPIHVSRALSARTCEKNFCMPETVARHVARTRIATKFFARKHRARV